MIGGAFAMSSAARRQLLRRAPDVVRAQTRHAAAACGSGSRRQSRPSTRFPSRQPCCVAVVRVGPSSPGAPAPAARHAVRYATFPEPRQWTATMLKRGVAAASVRAACSGTSRTISVGPARAPPQARRAPAATSWRGAPSSRASASARAGWRRPFPDTHSALVRALLAALGLAPGARRRRQRVRQRHSASSRSGSGPTSRSTRSRRTT